MFKGLFILIIFLSIDSYALPIKSAAGLELGGNGTALFSDPSLQAFGAGAGLQGSVFFTMWNDHPIAGKFRYEVLSMQEVALQKTTTDYVLPGTYLKSMTQGWDLISVGAEGHFTAQFQSFFWEALLGYAMGKPSTVSVSYGSQDSAAVPTSQTTSNGFALSGGIGIQREFSKKIIGIMSLRTMLFLGSIYNSNALVNKAFIPFPLMFNIGIQVPFDLGH